MNIEELLKKYQQTADVVKKEYEEAKKNTGEVKISAAINAHQDKLKLYEIEEELQKILLDEEIDDKIATLNEDNTLPWWIIDEIKHQKQIDQIYYVDQLNRQRNIAIMIKKMDEVIAESQKNMKPIRLKIKILKEAIEQQEHIINLETKRVSECLVKIFSGERGLQAAIAEKNTLNQIFYHLRNAENCGLAVSGYITERRKRQKKDLGQKKK